jgi:hypothetical protein
VLGTVPTGTSLGVCTHPEVSDESQLVASRTATVLPNSSLTYREPVSMSTPIAAKACEACVASLIHNPLDVVLHSLAAFVVAFAHQVGVNLLGQDR